MSKQTQSPIEQLNAQTGDSAAYYAIVETPAGSHNKYKYEPNTQMIQLHKVLPAGAVFPHDFGFIPNTLGGDGDPIDVLILTDQPAFPGCLVEVRLLGVIKVKQTKEGVTERNDRLIAAAVASHQYADYHTLKDMDPDMLNELEHFFKSYDEIEGKQFEALGRFGPDRARKLIKAGVKASQKARKKQAR